QYHKNIKSKIKNKDLSDNINNLCFNAIPLDERILDLFISDNELKDNFKYIIYNNVNALVSDFNIEYNKDENYELANRYINKFRNYFFQIPESVFLYLSFTHMLNYLKDDIFFKNILYYININRKIISDNQIEAIALLMFLTIDRQGNFYDISKTGKSFKNTIKFKDNLIGFQLFSFFYFCYNENKNFDIHKFNFLNHPKFYLFSDFIINEVKDLIDSLQEITDSIYSDKESIEAYQNGLKRFVEFLSVDFIPDRKAKKILEIYLNVNKHIISEHKIGNTHLNFDIINNYINTYNNILTFYKEDNKDSIYFKSFSNLKFSLTLPEIISLINKNDFNSLKLKFIEYIKSNDERALQNFIFYFIQNHNCREKDFIMLFLLYRIYFDNFKNISIKKVSELTIRLLNENNDDYDFKFPIKFLEYLITHYNKEIYQQLIYNIFSLLLDKILEYQSPPNPIKYNFIIKFLKFMIKAKSNKNFLYNITVVKTCIIYLEEILNRKKLKNVSIIYNQVLDVFNINKPKIFFSSPGKKKKITDRSLKYDNINQMKLFN
ncbi:MAG: hypothetical protein K8R58_06055, partial [Bacteroidales bacterium]|nr:hypothetical protein [Bacteroidales bacterium]